MNLAAPKYTGPTWAQPLPPALAARRDVTPAVVCVYWGDKYDVSYVRRLAAAVRACAQRPVDVFCVSDDERVEQWCTRIPSPVAFEGWWQKIGLFDRSVAAVLGVRPVLALDVDVVLRPAFDVLYDYEIPQDGLVMCENFGPNKPHCAHNSSAMMWVGGTCTSIAEDFRAEYMQRLHGDQCYIWRHHAARIDNWPREVICSYKYDVRGTHGVPAAARLVVFHGDPKPHECSEPWVRKYWHLL